MKSTHITSTAIAFITLLWAGCTPGPTPNQAGEAALCANCVQNGATTTDDDGDGYCAEDDDCDDSNPFINPGALEVCGNSVDENCDSVAEECPTCGEVGTPCDVNADCCSLRCHPRRKTCK